MMFKYMCLVLFITWYQLADCHPASSSSDVKSLDSMIDKESDAFLAVEAEQSNHKAVRDKRTIGFLRQLFPNFSRIVDQKIQQITRLVFRVIGRLVLRGGAGGGGGGATASGGGGNGAATGGGDSAGGRRISITLPTYPPSADDEEEEQTELPAAVAEVPAAGAEAVDSKSSATGTDVSSVSTTSPGSEAAVTEPAPALPAAADSSADSSSDSVTTIAPADVAVTTMATASTNTAAAVTTTNATPTTQMPSVSDNTVGTGIVKRTAREVSAEESSSSSQQKRSPLTDTDNGVSSDNSLSNTDDEAEKAEANDDPRNKRFLLNLRGGNGGGGSGNFLFDLIRLIAGSGANQDKDESSRDESPSASIEDAQEVHAEVNAKEDGYSVGVPGPLTRIFVIANRGVANLVQDLILRLAQTTERIVNFKARLITSLI